MGIWTPVLHVIPWGHPIPQVLNGILIGSAAFALMTAECPYFTMGRPFPPQIAPFHNIWVSESPFNTRANPSPQRKRHIHRFSRFCRAQYCDRQTNRPTDHATRSVTVGHIYVRSAAMRPNNAINIV